MRYPVVVARVFLVNPPSPEPVRTPLLSFCHLAASLRARRARGRAARRIGAVRAAATTAAIAARIAAFAPDLVGLHLKTLHVQPAYALARGARRALAARRRRAARDDRVPTSRSRTAFAGSIRGEGEEALARARRRLDGKRALAEVARAVWIDRGMVRHNAARGFLAELDALARAADRARSVRSGLVRRRRDDAAAGGPPVEPRLPGGLHVLLEQRHRAALSLSQRRRRWRPRSRCCASASA